MKHTKKLLALMIALLMGLGLCVPAMAEGRNADSGDIQSGEVNWDEFYVISQSAEEVVVPFGSDFTLSVELNIPAGVEVVYDWYSPRWGRTGKATEQVFHCSPDHPYYPKAPSKRPYLQQTEEYICIIYGIEKDAGGNVIGYAQYLQMKDIAVTVLPEREPTQYEIFRDRWIINPLQGVILFCMASYGTLIPFIPIIWLYFGLFPDGGMLVTT